MRVSAVLNQQDCDAVETKEEKIPCVVLLYKTAFDFFSYWEKAASQSALMSSLRHLLSLTRDTTSGTARRSSETVVAAGQTRRKWKSGAGTGSSSKREEDQGATSSAIQKISNIELN